MNNLLAARGLNLPKEALSSEKRLNEVLSLPFDELLLVELRVIVDQIRSLSKSIAQLDQTGKFRKLGSSRPLPANTCSLSW